ncbi:MAG: GntR family transcriptional regulator [Phycisphaeraceae bacterium]
MNNNVTDKALHKIAFEPLHDKVHKRLQNALMSAHFQPGSQVSLRATAKMLGVSVMTVRVAVLRLVAEKALQQVSNRNFFVPKIDQAEFEEIVFLRTTLEGIGAEFAASRRSQKQLASLKLTAKKLTQAGLDGDAETYLRANRNFKLGVVEAAQAPVLKDLVISLWVRFGPFMSHFTKNIHHQTDSDYQNEIVAAIASRDGATAREIIVRDITEGAEFLRECAGFELRSDLRTDDELCNR